MNSLRPATSAVALPQPGDFSQGSTTNFNASYYGHDAPSYSGDADCEMADFSGAFWRYLPRASYGSYGAGGEDMLSIDDGSAPCSPASSGVFSSLPSPSSIGAAPFSPASTAPSVDSGAEEDSDAEESPSRPQIASLVEVQGICHINLLDAQFLVSHNEQTNDFFLDLVRAGGAGSDSVLQAIFRFPEQRNGALELFTASYGVWSRPGRLVFHDDSPPCTRDARFGSCQHTTPIPAAVALSSDDEFGTSTSSSAPSQRHFRHNHNDKHRQHWHLQLHVYEQYYTIELNGKEIDRYNHRMAFEKIRRVN